jgi:hypothetical protein
MREERGARKNCGMGWLVEELAKERAGTGIFLS